MGIEQSQPTQYRNQDSITSKSKRSNSSDDPSCRDSNVDKPGTQQVNRYDPTKRKNNKSFAGIISFSFSHV